jgi:hypothetical protein
MFFAARLIKVKVADAGSICVIHVTASDRKEALDVYAN